MSNLCISFNPNKYRYSQGPFYKFISPGPLNRDGFPFIGNYYPLIKMEAVVENTAVNLCVVDVVRIIFLKC